MCFLLNNFNGAVVGKNLLNIIFDFFFVFNNFVCHDKSFLKINVFCKGDLHLQ